jgi:hypothetical protein
VRKVKKDPGLSDPKLSADLFEKSGKKVHPDTIRRVLKEYGYNGGVARKEPYINEKNRKKRLVFAKQFISKNSWWNNVFANESKFNLFGPDERKIVCRKRNQALNFRNLNPTIKHGGGNVMVWVCTSSKGVEKLVFINGIMNKNMYLDILKQNFKKSLTAMDIENLFKFYHYNDPKHKARIVQEYLLYKCPRVLYPQPQSPDLNPIENL